MRNAGLLPRPRVGPRMSAQDGINLKVDVPSMNPPCTHIHRETHARSCADTCARTHTHMHIHPCSATPGSPTHPQETALALAHSQWSFWLLFQTTGFNFCAVVALRENTSKTFRGLHRARWGAGGWSLRGEEPILMPTQLGTQWEPPWVCWGRVPAWHSCGEFSMNLSYQH